VLHSPDLHSEAALAAVREFAPTLGLSLAAPILKPQLFSLPAAGTLNLHKGKLPEHRGMPPAFWELWNDEASVGCSVHEVEAGLDTGRLVRTATVPRQKFSTPRGLQLTLDETGVDLMRAAVADVLAGKAASEPQASGGHTYRKPTLAQVAELRRRLCRGWPRAEPALARQVKDAVFRARITTRGLAGRFIAPRIAVLLFHRVSDQARDNLTVGIEQFERMIALVRRHCRPLSIEEVASGVMPRPGEPPAVCITFDDGYLDNYEHAAPILLRHEMPAAFFVSTGIIGTKQRFPHDERRGNEWIPVMSWDQLRAMRDQGFTIGSHSVSHIDCAAEPEAKVRAELEQSLQTLRHELSLSSAMFAYPYGRRSNMTPERLELVKAAGFSACLSAYGGVNVGAVDRFNILRTGIHWGFSDLAFLYRCFGFP
jgi:peptidoglycan/xylan/chitin deacetylase (PgdA/CDA1 family)